MVSRTGVAVGLLRMSGAVLIEHGLYRVILETAPLLREKSTLFKYSYKVPDREFLFKA